VAKNFQIIESAQNFTFDVYCVDDEIFQIIFPDGTDVAFLDEVDLRVRKQTKYGYLEFWALAYGQKVDKKTLDSGLHGTLHLTGSLCEKKLFPTRLEDEVINSYLLP